MVLPSLKVIDEQNTLRIPKYGGQIPVCWCLRLWSLWTAFICCCPLWWLPIWHQSEVVDPNFIHCHIFTQKTLFCCNETVANNALNSRRVVFDQLWANAHLLWTQLSHWQMFMQMVNTPHSDIFDSSAISCNFNLRKDKTSLLSFFVFSGTTTDLCVQHHLCLYDRV